MPLDFPTSPAPNEIYTFGGRSWIWNGIAWDVYSTVSGNVVTQLNGLTGGVTLAAGSNITLSPVGNTITIASTGGGGGISGPYVISLRGLTGAVGLTNGSGIGLSVSGNTLTFSNTGVLSIDGGTGDITNVARTNVANTFTALQSFSSGISGSNGATFATDLSVNSVLVGRGAGSIATNTVLGAAAFTSNISGTSNVAVGQQSLQSNTGGSSNTAIGRRALNALTVGSSNTSVGASSLLAFNGNNTVSIGANSGSSVVGGTGNVYVGANVAGTDAATREIVIGESAVGLGSNTTAIGRTDQTSATIYGLLNVPGGLSAAGATFSGLARFNAGISAAGATLSSLTTIPSGATLSVLGNITGNVVNSINGITGAVNLAAGSNITITPSGLTLTIAAGAGFSRSINVITTSTTAGATSNVDYVYIGNTSGNINLTLPTAVSNTNRYTVKNSNIGILTVLTTSSQTIDGITGYNLSKQFQAIDLLSDNSNWVVV